ncbi:sensor histidine kinase [Calothrix sp. PCC 6303]|uniref:sensor histidine kinase n=1 Tax=Calothrix sp. PCC 6303 TaxID=1170562 RepID=UPI0002A02371|nr:sensor histidine kinase [Calothrix sp. PCC 6303]AFZ04341.1 integral membrane sensor signal transduction histidine kinase [Calothrix sp. PCC 6303]
MAKPRQLSFRRILTSRILFLSVPILFIGEFAVFQKARDSLLETARKNLTESAVMKGEKIADTISSLKINLLSISQATQIRSGSAAEAQEFINKITQESPQHLECIQLIDLKTQDVIASTCGERAIDEVKKLNNSTDIQAKVIIPPKNYTNINTADPSMKNKLQILLSTPVYNLNGEPNYVLSIQSELQEKIRKQPGLFIGSSVVISEDGTILTHPITTRIGTNIAQHVDASRLKKIVRNAISGKKKYLHFFFEKQGEELVAGYTAIPSPVTVSSSQKWIILDVTTLDNVLYGLGTIKLVLFILTVVLIGASIVASLYVSNYLASPIEKLRDYALKTHSNQSPEAVSPDDFDIREFNQLAQAIGQMVERLKNWAEELEIAWKDAKDANQVKSQFLANTSHELRNPLNIIINSIRIVRDGLCDDREEELEFLQRADETAIHLLGLINDLLDISKIEAGKLSVFLEPVDLHNLLKEVINLQSVNVQQKGLKLNIPMMLDSIPVNIDPIKLKQVFINVIGNATKFTETGSITISTSIEEINAKPHVIIAFQDTGIGIDLSQQQKLFRPFVMVGDATSRKIGGTGLGLAISRNLIELMGGTITLSSPGINEGTTVTVTLPLIDPESSERENQEDDVVLSGMGKAEDESLASEIIENLSCNNEVSSNFVNNIKCDELVTTKWRINR